MRERFHYPSFRAHFIRKFDDSFNVYIHNWTGYVLTPNKYFTAEILQGLVIEGVIDAIDDPLGSPDGSRRGSLLDLPLESHVAALQETLLECRDYLEKREVSGVDGERVFEWRVDLKKVQDLIIQSRRKSDILLSIKFVEGEETMSNRLLREKILLRLGVKMSFRRVSDINKDLVKLECLENNGKVRTYGRDVLI